MLVESERVRGLKYSNRRIEGLIESRPRDIACALRFPKDRVVPENLCPCRDNREMGLFCPHAVALCLEQLNIENDPVRLAKLEEEKRRAERMARMGDDDYLTRVPAGSSGAIPVRLVLSFPSDPRDLWWQDRIPLVIEVEHKGQRQSIRNVRPDLKVSMPDAEDNLLFVLEDIAEGPVPGELSLTRRDLANVLDLMPGMRIGMGDRMGTVSTEQLTVSVALELEEETGQLVLDLETRLPDDMESCIPAFWAEGRSAWALVGEILFQTRPLLPEALSPLVKEPLRIPRADVPAFIRRDLKVLENLVTLRSEVDPKWFSFEAAQPGFRLEVRGSPASLSATLFAEYEGVEWIAGAEESLDDWVSPDADNILHYRTRNLEAEKEALNSLRTLGFGGERGDRMEGLVGTSPVLTFCAAGIPLLRRRGWKVDLNGRIADAMESADTLMPVVSVQEGQNGWFDVQFEFETTEGESLDLKDVRRALASGNAFVKRGEKTWLFDRSAAQNMFDLFEDCGEGMNGSGHTKLPSVHAAYLKSTLDGLDGVDVEATPAWLERVEQQNQPAKLEPVSPSDRLQATLRPYQMEGLNWLRFLEKAGFAGILADEMGLGKTLQTLAWLQLNRVQEDAEELPALIVCPTSLVENWIEEGERFTPDLRFVNLTGSPAQRDRVWETEGPGADVWVTSYAVVQRDLARYIRSPLSSLILDEAQHIKNRNTQNAKAVKKLQAVNRLVLTGTPVENSVSDLWSIMDFLMPGYLTTHELFRQRFEAPIRSGGAEGADAQARLRKKLQPFLLRRLKRDVAKDLPPKIEKTAYCRMTNDQRLVYQELVRSSSEKLEALVAQQGYERSRMQVLQTLLRLRQACCHLGLLGMEGLEDSKAPSGKLDLFKEMVLEAVDGGHRVLVFSQFTKMLGLLRGELDQLGLSYCYLDGSTKHRMDEVRKFQGDSSIPLFLISLKAGGTGLNLTGADMVIHYDPWWNPAVENQATDRAYRIGQQRNVYSLKLITRDSVEEKVLALQQRKQQVIDATLDTDAQMLQSLDWEDVQDLLKI